MRSVLVCWICHCRDKKLIFTRNESGKSPCEEPNAYIHKSEEKFIFACHPKNSILLHFVLAKSLRLMVVFTTYMYTRAHAHAYTGTDPRTVLIKI